MALCLTDDMDALVKPEKKEQWINEKTKWFVVDPKDPYDIRLPGKMKLEWSTKRGAMVA